MKKITVLLCLTFLAAGFVFSQEIRLDYKITYKTGTSGISADITVTVNSGSPDFTYYLTTNHPVNGKVIMKSDPTKKESFTFENVKPGTYFIKVEDASKQQAGQSIIINENEN
jgi:hypothetical protein